MPLDPTLDPDSALNHLYRKGPRTIRLLPRKHLRPLTITLLDRLHRLPNTPTDSLRHAARRYLRHSGIPCWAKILIQCVLTQIIDLLISYARKT